MSSPAHSNGDATRQAVAFADVPGWADDDHRPALAAFEQSCTGPHPSVIEAAALFAEETRDAARPRRDAALVPACNALRAAGGASRFDAESARMFFEDWFDPNRVVLADEAPGQVTAYYEPVLDGSRTQSASFPAPLFARPDDLVVINDTNRPAGFPSNLSAARQTDSGLHPYPDRLALLQATAWSGLEPIVWLAHPVDAYFVHIQGSVRINLAEGGTLRLGYAGKNGHPYRSAGRAMIERGHVPAAGMTAEAMKAWLKANPELSPELLGVNPSYVFFREINGLGDDLGPIGAEGVPLTAGRSLAVDPSFIPYGTPVHIAADLPTGAQMASQRFQRLMVAQDTGSAIRGPARGDLFWGTGVLAGEIAGRINNAADFVVLQPRSAARR